MEALEKAKLALRKHILENKERVAADLEEMRNQSEGEDIFSYVENISGAFSFDMFASTVEIEFDLVSLEIDCGYVMNDLIENSLYPPPKNRKGTQGKKDSEIFSESFFCNIATC